LNPDLGKGSILYSGSKYLKKLFNEYLVLISDKNGDASRYRFFNLLS